MLTLGAPLSREVGDCFLPCSGIFPGHLPVFEQSSREIEASPTPNERRLVPTLYPQGIPRIGVEPSGQQGGPGKILGVLRLIGTRGAADAI
jgi:hypothetical protein